MWYAVQVMTGDEKKICLICKKALSSACYQEIFIPYYIRMKRYQGSWHEEKRVLFPGYIFIDAGAAEPLFFSLKKIQALTKILKNADCISPIYKEEQEFLEHMMDEKGVVPMSIAYQTGEKINVTEGPLKDYPARICRIDRHKRLAEIEVTLFGKPTRATVGLELVEKG